MTADRRRYGLLLAYAVILIPTVAIGAREALKSNNNSPLDWVPPQFPPRANYDGFCQRFGPGDTVVLGWPGCNLSESRLDELTQALRTADVFRDEHDRWLFQDVISGREALAMLLEPVADGVVAFTREDAIGRLQGTLIGKDANTTVVVITFTREGLRQRAKLVELIQSATRHYCGVAKADQRLAGPVIDGLSVDRASQETLDRFAVPSAIVVFILCWAGLRSLKASVALFGVALFCQGATLALLHYSGETMSALLVVLPAMIQVLAVAGGIHLTNYYFDSADSGTAEDAAQRALRLGWLPCVLSAATTAIGMATLMCSGISPIRSFGLYSSAGVVFTTAVLLSVLPAVYVFWPPRQRASTERMRRLNVWPTISPWSPLVSAIRRGHGVISFVGLASIVAGCWYVTQLKTSVRIETFFAKNSRILSDYAWLEEHIGPLVPLEVVVTCNQGSPLSDYDKIALLKTLGERLCDDPRISVAFSPAQLIPPLPDHGFAEPQARREFVEEASEMLRPAFEQMRFLAKDNGNEHWRLSLRCSALGNDDYGELLAMVRSTAESVVNQPTKEHSPEKGASEVDVHVTGIMPLVHEIQHELLRDLLKSFLGAMLLITVLMTLVQAGVLAGLIAMASNVLPIVVFFGALGWRSVPVDIGTVMTASIALGIAVDDTLHFLTFFRRGMSQGSDRPAAVRFAMEHCGSAMVQTSVSCGLGLMVFALSDFLPTSRFAWSMATLLAIALAADLIFLPALLLGPLGRFLVDEQAATSVPTMSPHATSANDSPVPPPHSVSHRPFAAGRR